MAINTSWFSKTYLLNGWKWCQSGLPTDPRSNDSLKTWSCRGAPEVVHTDNGTEFSNRMIEQTCKGLGIFHTTNPVYLAQANPTERVNRVLKTMIVAFLRDDHKEWDLHLHEFRFAYNTPVDGSLRVTPAFLNFGREPLPYRSLRSEVNVKHERCFPEPSDWLERMERLSHLRDLITSYLDRAYETQAKYYDKHRR